MEVNKMKLESKIILKGKIKLLTGLHIGGSSTTMKIGGIDANVIKGPDGIPYIPGSSLKGKMRYLLEMKGGINEGKNKSGEDSVVCSLFGTSAENAKQPGRLIVRDAPLDKSAIYDNEEKKPEFKELEFDYTEGKWENTIDRTNSHANPRQLERVPAGAEFNFEFIFNEYDIGNNENLFNNLVIAMKLLEDDYLGGSGSRGYGKIKFEDISIIKKKLKNDEYKKVEGSERKVEKIDDLTDEIIKEIFRVE
jgi:CRISPR-associated protein Csm3